MGEWEENWVPQKNLPSKSSALLIKVNVVNVVEDLFQKQRKKIGFPYTDWANVIRDIPQRSILQLLLFIIFITDVFLFTEKSDICKFAHDNAIFSCGDNLSAICESLEDDIKIILRWLNLNSLEANSGKF